MTKGYLLFAVDTKKVKYSQLAYACALTIKLTQPNGFNSVSVVTDDIDNFDNCKNVFDQIIKYSGPTGMDVRSRAYDYTPYDETVILDSDMLFLTPAEHYWEMLNNIDLYVTSAPQTYNGQPFHYGPYRQLFLNNQLLDVYSAWTYFKKSNLAEEFFDLVKTITDNPAPFIAEFLPSSQLTTIPTDEAFALALQLLDINMPLWDFPRITHMKPLTQGWPMHVDNWNDRLRFSMDKTGQVKLGVWQQTDLLHYVNKNLITPQIIKTLEEAL